MKPLSIDWAGGRHSELRVKTSETGRSRLCTDPEAIEVLRQMAGRFTHRQIAATLNRLSCGPEWATPGPQCDGAPRAVSTDCRLSLRSTARQAKLTVGIEQTVHYLKLEYLLLTGSRSCGSRAQTPVGVNGA